MTKKEQEIVKVPCTVEGYESFWISYDVTTWGMAEYYSIPHTPRYEIVREVIPQYSVDWYMESDDGTIIAHPGQGASNATWLNVWRQLGVRTGRALHLWLSFSAMTALGEAMSLQPKSDDSNTPGGGGKDREPAD